jgi:hypothetical protein
MDMLKNTETAKGTKMERASIGIPYAPVIATWRNGQTVRCPICGLLIKESTVKDADSYTLREYQRHYSQSHVK